MIIFYEDEQWKHTGTVAERIYTLKAALDLYTEASSRTKWTKSGKHDLYTFRALWESGIFNLVALEEITSVSRKTLSKWLKTKGTPQRPRGRVTPAHLPVLISRLNEERNEHQGDIEEFIAALVEEGSSEVLVRAVLQREKEEGEKVAGDAEAGAGAVRGAHRPDDEGHPAGSQGVLADLLADQDDDGPGDSEERDEPGDPGEVQGASGGDEASEPSPVEVERVELVHSRVDAEGRTVITDECGTEIIGDDWNPLDDFEFDESGDSLLLDSDDEGGSTAVPGLPDPGAPWEQAEETES